MKKDCTNTIYGWTPGTDAVGLVAWPDLPRASRRFQMTAGACNAHQAGASFKERQIIVLADALATIVRDGCEPLAVHQALMGLSEYAAAMADDMPKVAL